MSGGLVRKQPERKAKKRSQESMANSKSEKFSKVPRRQSKSKMTTNSTSFDPIGELLSNYGEITGESLAHEIFSYLDFSTLQQIRLVRQSWNSFLTKDRRLWLNILKGTKPFIEFLINELVGKKYSDVWKECFDKIAISDDFSCVKVYQTMRKIQGVFMVFQAFTGFYNVFGKFKDYFVGEKLTEEIRMEIYGRKKPFLVWLQKNMEAIDINAWKKEMVKDYYLFERFSTNPNHPNFVSAEQMNYTKEIEALDNEYEKLSNVIILGFKQHLLGI